jgi:NAD(P)-dependent dehydrogenase (short-subunit alcohol dehydrogenase family)
VRIEGNVALVTGAASGLGQVSAARLKRAGARVVHVDLNEAAVSDGDAFVKCNVTSEEEVQGAVAAAADLGRLAMVVHCAGGGIAARTLSRDGTPHSLDAFKKVIDLNLVGTFNVLRLSAAQMAKNEPDEGGERGAFVMTASIAGFEGQIGQVAYGSAKAGIIGMTIIAARDLAAIGVRVCTIAPGTMGTALLRAAPASITDALVAGVPFPKRMGEPDEFAALAQHIIENGYLNGEVIRIDGAVRFQPK